MNGLQVKAGTQEKDPVTSPLTITTENVTSATTTQVTKVTLQMIPADIQLVFFCVFLFSQVTLDIIIESGCRWCKNCDLEGNKNSLCSVSAFVVSRTLRHSVLVPQIILFVFVALASVRVLVCCFLHFGFIPLLDCERGLLGDSDWEKDYNHRGRRCGPASGEEDEKGQG